MTPPNKAMKLTSLSAAPGLSCTTGVDGGAASCPRGFGTAGTASQLIAGVRLTRNGAGGECGRAVGSKQAKRAGPSRQHRKASLDGTSG